VVAAADGGSSKTAGNHAAQVGSDSVAMKNILERSVSSSVFV